MNKCMLKNQQRALNVNFLDNEDDRVSKWIVSHIHTEVLSCVEGLSFEAKDFLLTSSVLPVG